MRRNNFLGTSPVALAVLFSIFLLHGSNAPAQQRRVAPQRTSPQKPAAQRQSTRPTPQRQTRGERKLNSNTNARRISGFPAEAERAAKALKLSKDFNANLFAAEPLLANPVAFCIDEKNRFYVCETFRLNRGVEDNREHEEWVNDDLAARSVDDRLAFYKKHLGEDLKKLTKHEDRIRLVMDRNGDGRADKSTVFVDGFNGPLEGTGAGVLARRGNVYYACIPKLWALRDQDGDGKAELKQALHEGYGVRVAFIGHDLHGLCIGPDGRLYFSIGDRGYNVETKSGNLADAESGAVFRCELDGSRLEVVATGLRNPQDLEFDDYGNLFTGDNNSDSGDLARWLHIVPHADYGWRMAFQYMPNRGPWNRERMWEPRHAKQPSYIMPPVANVGDGPSGIAYYPGTGMTNSYRGNFFLCDFRGEAGLSGVRTFKMKPNGASFNLIDEELFVWNCLPTDVQFGADGAMYISDWVNGWGGTGKGRIFRIAHSKGIGSKGAKEVAQILAKGLGDASKKQLSRLLAHPDRRLRMEAQFQLTGDMETGTLSQVAHTSKIQLARLHGVWGLGQIARIGDKESRAKAIEELEPLINDTDDEVRYAATFAIAECGDKGAIGRILRGLKDKFPRVRYASAMALATLNAESALEPLIELLEENNDQDHTIRHACIMGLVNCSKPRELRELAKHDSKAVRIATVVALRRLKSPSVALFLTDNDPNIVTEAARAIYDTPINDALPALAAMKPSREMADPLAVRIIAANARIGGRKNAVALAEFATNELVSAASRFDAIKLLNLWTDPSPRDFVTGLWRPVEGDRNEEFVTEAITANLKPLLESDNEIRVAAAQLAGRLKIEEAEGYLEDTVADKAKPDQERAGALLSLASMGEDGLRERVDAAMEDDAPAVRAAARMLLMGLDEEAAVEPLWQAIRSSTQLERQSAIELLAKGKSEAAQAKMAAVVQALLKGQVPGAVRLDIYEAARSVMAENEKLAEMVVEYESTWDKDDNLAPYRDMLEGGDAERGKRIYFENAALQCTKCHKMDGRGSEIGPDLSKVATSLKRDEIMESIVYPNEKITKGYETLVLELDDGRVVSGILKKKGEKQIELMDADGKVEVIDIDAIEDQSRGQSAMPANLANQVSPFQLRDLVEYLSTKK